MDKQHYPQTPQYQEPIHTFAGLERLICAALADPALAVNLLSDPTAAIMHIPPTIELSSVEQALVSSISGATDIHDFAARLYDRMRQATTSDISQPEAASD